MESSVRMAQLGGIGAAVGCGVGAGVAGRGDCVGRGLDVGCGIGVVAGSGVADGLGVVITPVAVEVALGIGTLLCTGIARACEQAPSAKISVNGTMRRRLPTAPSVKRLGRLQRGRLASWTRRSTDLLL
ncbi:MAG TPA: hypothetical protein VFM12_04880, partial [Gemmatimonadales bacterium]|nr:hypothetical protein [Gemmatimonadales bacterium]